MTFLGNLFKSNWLASREEMARFLERYFGWRPRNSHNEWDDFENLNLRDAGLEEQRILILEELGPINGPLSDDERAIAEAKARRIIARLRSPGAPFEQD